MHSGISRTGDSRIDGTESLRHDARAASCELFLSTPHFASRTSHFCFCRRYTALFLLDLPSIGHTP
jgi:hypothetical protein